MVEETATRKVGQMAGKTGAKMAVLKAAWLVAQMEHLMVAMMAAAKDAQTVAYWAVD